VGRQFTQESVTAQVSHARGSFTELDRRGLSLYEETCLDSGCTEVDFATVAAFQLLIHGLLPFSGNFIHLSKR
jgi:hypothetical protein